MTLYTFQPIPNNPYDNNIPQDTVFSGINDTGEAVGDYTASSSSSPVAFLYNPDSSANNGYTPIIIPGASGSWATGINSSGQIVGSTYTSQFSGFLDNDGVFTTIAYPTATSRPSAA
jgi:hypothetical protein